MTRIITCLLGILIGGSLGYLHSPMGALIGAIALCAIGYNAAQSSGYKINRKDKKTMAQAMDMAFILFWAASPALKRLLHNQERYLAAESQIWDTCFPLLIDEQMSFRDETLEICRETVRLGTIPHAALKRHNRAFRPGMFRKKSASYTILDELARLLLAAGSDRRGIIWYFHVAEKLHVKPEHAIDFLANAVAMQKSDMRMIPGFPSDESPLGQAHKGIPVSDKVKPYLEWYEAQRAEILDLMFGDSSRAA